MLPADTGRYNTNLVQALLADALGWSSEKWPKASGRATVGLDQGRARLSTSIPTFLDYIRCDAQSHWNTGHLVMSMTKINDWSSLVGETLIAGDTPVNNSARYAKCFARSEVIDELKAHDTSFADASSS
jgi:hypothetical protein